MKQHLVSVGVAMRMCFVTVVVAGLMMGCASAPAPKREVPQAQSVELKRATQITEQPLNVSILLLDASAKDGSLSRIYAPIRNAEAAFLPILLRNTLDDSGHWGAVSVVPSLDTASEVFVTGQILHSDALTLKIRFKVFDSRGVVWLDRDYNDFAEAKSYETEVGLSEDPFQDLFDQLSNDMAMFLSDLSDVQIGAILDTAMLRYATLLSPEAFQGYLKEDDQGQLQLAGLPAFNDPLYRRVRSLRDREYEIQDIVDDHFENFFDDMQRVYPFWRQSSFELLAYNVQLESGSSGGRGAWQDVERVYRLYRERKLNEDELRELATSFEREIDPTVAELEGRVIELQGSLLDQYQNWRRVLRDIYAQTAGATPDLTAPN